MLECLIIGDSVAAGLAQAMPECSSLARGGISSKAWHERFQTYPPLNGTHYRFVVISLGKDDYVGDSIEEHLYDVRAKLAADHVIWLMPNPTLKPTQHAIIAKLAAAFKDKVLHFHEVNHTDGMHPNKYATLASKVRDRLR